MTAPARKGLFSEYFASLETKGTGEELVAGTSRFLWSGLKYTDKEDEREEAEKHVDIKSPLASFEKANRVSLEILDKVRDQLNWLDLKQTCIHCHVKYLRKENIGFLKCRWHPEPLIDLVNYSCCGQKRDIYKPGGCKRCDHGSKQDIAGRWHEKNKVEVVPLIVALELHIPSQNYTIADEDDVRKTKALVKRCEFYSG
jgi:hypothetical protein